MTPDIDQRQHTNLRSLIAAPPRLSRVAGSLPRAFRRARLLIVGCGDVGMRLLSQLGGRTGRTLGVVAITRGTDQHARIRAFGARALAVDLDDRRALRRLSALAAWTVHLAPPPAQGGTDTRMRHLLAACRPAMRRRRLRARPPVRWTYISTTGVYGDAGGARFDETRPVAPGTARARRRVDAERQVRSLAKSGVARASILRVPGLYAHDRLPVERLRRATPALNASDDVYTNHLHAEDLAHATWLALFRARPARVYHAVDDLPLKAGDYLDRVADALGMARAPRVPREAIAAQIDATRLSFLGESRQLDNRRLVKELRCRLFWPTVELALADLVRRTGKPRETRTGTEVAAPLASRSGPPTL